MPPGQQAHGVPQVPRCVSLKGLPPPATAHPGPRGVAFPAGVSAPPRLPQQAAAQAGVLTLGSCPGP